MKTKLLRSINLWQTIEEYQQSLFCGTSKPLRPFLVMLDIYFYFFIPPSPTETKNNLLSFRRTKIDQTLTTGWQTRYSTAKFGGGSAKKLKSQKYSFLNQSLNHSKLYNIFKNQLLRFN